MEAIKLSLPESFVSEAEEEALSTDATAELERLRRLMSARKAILGRPLSLFLLEVEFAMKKGQWKSLRKSKKEVLSKYSLGENFPSCDKGTEKLFQAVE